MSHPLIPTAPPLHEPHYGIGLADAVKRGFAKYATFSGRASLSEYWWFALAVAGIWLALGVVAALASQLSETLGSLFLVLWWIFYLGTLLPLFAAGVRRLHDAGHSGWYCLISFIPLVGSLLVFIAMVSGTRPNATLYGPPYYDGHQPLRPMGATGAPQATAALPAVATAPAHPAVTGSAADRSSLNPRLIVAMAVVTAMLAGGVAGLLVRDGTFGAGSGTAAGTSDVDEATDPLGGNAGRQGGEAGGPSGGTTPGAGTDAERSPSPEPTPTVEPRPEDPPATSTNDVTVISSSDGDACDTTSDMSKYGDYPIAKCRLWKDADGLLYGEPVAEGGKRITCQRDLEIENPVYSPGQENTWWVWTTSEDGTWDWYPETAIAEGASNQPINGIAVCQGSS